MTDNEIVKALECCRKLSLENCKACPYYALGHGCLTKCFEDTLDLINRQKAEIERLEEETQNARKKALQEATSKFAGHSDYHGDTILCKLICMAEGKEVGVARPLDISRIKAEAVKEFAVRLTMQIQKQLPTVTLEKKEIIFFCLDDIDNLVKEFTEGRK